MHASCPKWVSGCEGGRRGQGVKGTFSIWVTSPVCRGSGDRAVINTYTSSWASGGINWPDYSTQKVALETKTEALTRECCHKELCVVRRHASTKGTWEMWDTVGHGANQLCKTWAFCSYEILIGLKHDIISNQQLSWAKFREKQISKTNFKFQTITN